MLLLRQTLKSIKDSIVEFPEQTHAFVRPLQQLILSIEPQTRELQFLHCILEQLVEHPDRTLDIIDSLSDNQFAAKDELIRILDEYELINENTTAAIFGSWYGSILIEYLAPRVKYLYVIDMDDYTNRISRDFFEDVYPNINWSSEDVFEHERRVYHDCNLFINTSCEHMKPMKEWPWWHYPEQEAHFLFQSNDMFDIEGHINCVNMMEEFEQQLPPSNILERVEVDDTRGTRFTILGRLNEKDIRHNLEHT